MYLSDAHQIRSADAEMIEKLGFPGIILMETAGRKAAERILHHFPAAPHYLILVGPGNNGGDGWVIARYLILAGKPVTVYGSHDPDSYQGDARLAWQAIQKKAPFFLFASLEPANLRSQLPTGTVLIDALLGTGVKGALRAPIKDIIEVFIPAQGPVVAIDLPSGLDADTGKVSTPPLPATLTLTFQLPKICHHITPAANFCGTVEVLDIGIWPEVVENLGISRQVTSPDALPLIQRSPDGHKGSFGHALVMGGSKNMAGAIALCGTAALHAGAGLATALLPASGRCAFYQSSLGVMTANMGTDATDWLAPDHLSEAIGHLSKKSAVAIGPGMGTQPATQAFFQEFIPHIQMPLVIDADGLNILAQHPEVFEQLPPHTVLTPHPGEMARLTGREDVNENRLEIAESFARERKVILILKGAGTIVALPDGRTWVNPTGNPGMGTAGMGDVLTGILVSLLAQGYAPELAARMGVYLHGLAGDLMASEHGQAGVTAEGILPFIGKAILALKNQPT